MHEWEIYHVRPINDIKKHSLSHACHCIPKLYIEGENMVVVHNSFDGREGVEWTNEILNGE